MGWIIVIMWLARLILLGLVGMSVYALSIIIERRKFFKENGLSEETVSGIRELSHLDRITEKKSIFYLQLMNILNAPEPQKAVDQNTLIYKKDEEGNLSTLGTFGATAPFIGLLGTVFGIIVAFGELSTGKIDTNGIMFALAEALILTAVGLVVAIPSVMYFNHFGKKLKTQKQQVQLLAKILK
ncbi:MAG: hypothetical protein CME61_04940 [Halobacteriovoraceae bacterium]|nr:hypothetical protein [Halobacteriovoraceae bacterium]